MLSCIWWLYGDFSTHFSCPVFKLWPLCWWHSLVNADFIPSVQQPSSTQLLCGPSKAVWTIQCFSGNLHLIFKKLFMEICKEDIIHNSNYKNVSNHIALFFWVIWFWCICATFVACIFEAEPLYLRLTCNLLGSPDPPWTFSISPVSDSWTLELLMCVYRPRSDWCTYYTYCLIYNTPLFYIFFICNHCLGFCWTWTSNNIYLFVCMFVTWS